MSQDSGKDYRDSGSCSVGWASHILVNIYIGMENLWRGIPRGQELAYEY